MENKEGKRVKQTDGASAVSRGPKTAAIAVGIVLVVLLGGYLGLCAFASSGSGMYPNTTVLGTDVSGMDAQAAAQAVQADLSSRLAGRSLTLTDKETGHSATIPCDIVSPENLDGAIGSAVPSDNFLTSGYQYLSHLVAPTEISAGLTLSDAGKQALRDAGAQLSSDLANPMVETTYTVSDGNLVFTKGTTGTGVDEDALEADVLSAITSLLEDGSSQTDIPVTLSTVPPEEPDFEAIYQEVYVEPADAYLDKSTKEIVSSVTGVSFDIAAARSAVDSAAEGAAVTVPLTYTQPEMTTEKLNANLFKDVLGSGSTSCAGPSNRWYNIDLAAGRLNNTILLPGETFSYNDTVGPYTKSSGYRDAGTYQNGQSIDATAGGICQLSSTLYWVTLKANLEIVERNKHAFNGGYMPVVGTDATVWSDQLDYRFKNNTDYPVKITSYLDSSHRVHVTIYGTNTTGIHGEPYSVTISTVPYKNTYKPNSSIPVGTEPQRDTNYSRYNGITVDVYQKLVDANGNTVDTIYLYRNTYKSSDAVYYYNPADAARWGIDPSTGLKTLTPVAPTPSHSATPTPSPSNTPVVSVTPTTAPSTAPSVAPTPTPAPVATPSPTPPAAETPAPPPEQSTQPTPDTTPAGEATPPAA